MFSASSAITTASRNLSTKALDFVQCGAGGTRTPYLFNAIEALSQLSYSPIGSSL